MTPYRQPWIHSRRCGHCVSWTEGIPVASSVHQKGLSEIACGAVSSSMTVIQSAHKQARIMIMPTRLKISNKLGQELHKHHKAKSCWDKACSSVDIGPTRSHGATSADAQGASWHQELADSTIASSNLSP